MRTTLTDRPGALATLALECGKAGVDIRALQVFPGAESVTDDLVLEVPSDWGRAELSELVERAGGTGLIAVQATEEALVDQPTRFVEAARSVLAAPESFPEVAARLFDAGLEEVVGDDSALMELTVGDVEVQVRRTTPFTATEQARGAAMAALVGEVLTATRAEVTASDRDEDDDEGENQPTLVRSGAGVSAIAAGVVIGRATLLTESTTEPGSVPVDLRVDRAWRGRGVGTRLLAETARLAAESGVHEIVLTAHAENRAVLPMVLAANLRGRIRLSGAALTVRIGVSDQRRL